MRGLVLRIHNDPSRLPMEDFKVVPSTGGTHEFAATSRVLDPPIPRIESREGWLAAFTLETN